MDCTQDTLVRSKRVNHWVCWTVMNTISNKICFWKHQPPLGHWVKFTVGQCWCHVEGTDSRSIHTRYEHCTLYRSNLTHRQKCVDKHTGTETHTNIHQCISVSKKCFWFNHFTSIYDHFKLESTYRNRPLFIEIYLNLIKCPPPY